MSWVEIDDVGLGRVVIELQPTVLEVFTLTEGHRFHLRMLAIEHQGPDGQGSQRVTLRIPGGRGVTLTTAEHHWVRLWPLLEQARAAQYPYMGY